MTQTTRPDKQRVRDLLQQHIKEKTPPMSPEQIKRELGWGLLKDSGKR